MMIYSLLFRRKRTYDIIPILKSLMSHIFSPHERVAEALGMSARAVRQLVQRQRTSGPPTEPQERPATIDGFTIGAIRRHIHARFASKEYVTVESMLEGLKVAEIVPPSTSETTFRRILHQMKFRYRTSQRKMYVRKESLDIVCRRIKALRSLKRHPDSGHQILYLDETWFTTRMSHGKEWVDATQPSTSATHSRQVPPGDGERFIMVAAGTESGFIDESVLSFVARNKSDDYHGEMNSELFQRWLTTRHLPALDEPSVLVLDNAPYHSMLSEESRCPTSATRKADLVSWLVQRGIAVPAGATRPELLLLCQQHRPEPQYVVDCLIREWGHEMVRLPPGHPELSAIEQVWGAMKRYIRSSLQRFTRADLQARLEEAKQLATGEVWAAAVRRARQFEDAYWRTDNVQEPTVDPVIITADDDEDDEDDQTGLTDLGSGRARPRSARPR